MTIVRIKEGYTEWFNQYRRGAFAKVADGDECVVKRYHDLSKTVTVRPQDSYITTIVPREFTEFVREE